MKFGILPILLSLAGLAFGALPAAAVTPLCDHANSFGSEVMTWSAATNTQQKAEAFENRWKKQLDPLSAAHRQVQVQVPEILPALQVRNQFFQLAFSRSGEIVQLCGMRKKLEAKVDAFLTAQKALDQADSIEQCASFHSARENYEAANSLYSDFTKELEKRFNTSIDNRGWPKGTLLQEFFQLRNTNQSILQQNSARLATFVGPLQNEVALLWGKGTLPKSGQPLPLEPSGHYSRFSLEGIAELKRSRDSQKTFSQYSGKLATLTKRCENSAAKVEDATDTDDKSRQVAPEQTERRAEKTQNKGEGSFLSRNWGWLAGGAILGGGGYYLYHESQQVKEQQAKWDQQQMDYNAQLAVQANQLATATSVTTQTSTSTATSTDTNTAAVTISTHELEPVELEILGTGDITPKGMPTGSFYIPAERLIRWIPKKGDAGAKEFTLASGESSRKIKIDVKATSTESGPPDWYRDGDVGYIFVHGAGENDRCRNSADLQEYWGSSPHVISPSPNYRTVACYDGSQAVATQAEKVAEQILKAPCGKFGRCIIITHSMGGLLMEHMFIHTREAKASDKEPGLFDKRAIYQKAKERTLFVISLASAAGGSKVANILQNAGDYERKQKLVGKLSRMIGLNNNAYRNLQSNYASEVVAPIKEDPGVPFFMVGGYSLRTMREERGFINFLESTFFDNLDAKIFNADPSCTSLDYVAEFGSRSDGLVDFRSACGIADGNEDAGPGNNAKLSEHFRYCATGTKKPNHNVWFLMNLNHMELALPSIRCGFKDNPCESRFLKGDTFERDPTFAEKDVMHVMRTLLTRNKSGAVPKRNALDLGF